MNRIESRQNPALRHLARLGREKKYRTACGEMLCEGEKMLHEALESGACVKTLLVRADDARADRALLARAEQSGAAVYEAPDALLRLASDVESPQGVLFACAQPGWDERALQGASRALLLDGLQDPGNLGTILRTADAFALDAVILCEGCADPFAPKVVRATMGSVFRLPCPQLPLVQAVALLRQNGLAVYATALSADSLPLQEAALSRAAVIIGSEGRGVSQQALALADGSLIIPMGGRAESLNAGVAASIVIYQMTHGREKK